MSEGTPETPTLDDFAAAVRKATLEGMKDYDRERDEWESAVAEQDRQRQESEKDTPPAKSGGGIGAFLLGGSKAKSG